MTHTLILSRTQPDPMPLPPIPRPSKAYRLMQVGVGLLCGSVLGLAGLAYIGVAVTR
ncbi:MAG: hypothetical protein V4515_15075 [Chloroflexota bacterium]